MKYFSSPAIILRRVDFGDYDVILTLFSLEKGKVSAIAKSAKKSIRRFGGILEIFSVLNVICGSGKGGSLVVLQEADLISSLSDIRTDFNKTAYASYWSEIVNAWAENDAKQERLYRLLYYVLEQINSGHISEETLSILFQMRFASIAGICPNLVRCSMCQLAVDSVREERISFNFKKGGVVCRECAEKSGNRLSLSKGTIKQLLWINSGDLKKAAKIRFTCSAIDEGLNFLEDFVTYNLGKEMQSLKILKQIRNRKMKQKYLCI
jgi:DNA repair protein RecO (recombination protein O)